MPLLTVNEVQKYLKVSRACVYALIGSGQLPCIRVGVGRGTIRVDEVDLLAFIEQCKQAPQKPAARPSSTGSGFVHLNADRLRKAWKADE